MILQVVFMAADGRGRLRKIPWSNFVQQTCGIETSSSRWGMENLEWGPGIQKILFHPTIFLRGYPPGN